MRAESLHTPENWETEFTISNFRTSCISLPLTTPMHLPFGTVTSRPSGILQLDLTTSKGQYTGYAEGATLDQPLFTRDSRDNIAKNIANYLEPAIGKPLTLTRLIDSLHSPDLPPFPTATMTIEMALLDALAKSQDTTIATLLGLTPGTTVPYGKSLGGNTTENILSQALQSHDSGARRIKLKISPSTFHHIYRALIELSRSHQFDLMIDANGTFDPLNSTHLGQLALLDSLGLTMIEEPCSRAGTYQGLTAIKILYDRLSFQTPICLDDCLTDLSTTKYVIDHDLADIVNIKPGRIGSIVAAIHLAHDCRNSGKQVMVGGMLEATPGRVMTTTLAAYFHTLGFTIPGDLSLPQERLAADLVTPPFPLTYTSGRLTLPQEPGWGFGPITAF